MDKQEERSKSRRQSTKVLPKILVKCIIKHRPKKESKENEILKNNAIIDQNTNMSSSQESMEDEDSIPPPEYEKLKDNMDDDMDDDDDEFWKDSCKTKPMEKNNRQGTTSSTQETPAELPSRPNSERSLVSKDVPAPMDDDSDEISYDEADDNFEEDDDEEGKEKKDSSKATYIESKDTGSADPSNTSSSTSVTTTAATTITTNMKSISPTTVDTVIENKTSTTQPKTNASSNMVYVLYNGKVTSPLSVNPTVLKTQIISPGKQSPVLSSDKQEPVRSSTPSCGKGTREFLALQKSFTDSKVLSEFVVEKDRSRKSRKIPLKSAESASEENEKFRICRARSKSCTKTVVRPSAMLNSSAPQRWPSDEKLNSKRENMRSQNTEFVQKQMKFLSRVNHDPMNADEPMSEVSDGEQSLNESNKTTGSLDIKDDCWQPPPKGGSDSYCWKCRKCADLIACATCPRSFHPKCVKLSNTFLASEKTWVCPECITLENCINGSKKHKKENMSIDLLNQLLLFALKRMKEVKGHERLLDVPDPNECPTYKLYVVNPVTLNSIQEKIERKEFRCTEEFVLETKWIQHNVSTFLAFTNKDILVAKTLLKVCRQEATEIETCSECYLNANTRKDWFLDVCIKPHILVWAKLKGFPYWPAKGMGVGPNALLNVRFFGDHDRAFVPIKDCYLYSAIDPNPHTGKRSFRPGIADCIKEIDVHIEKIRATVGAFNYAPPKTLYDPNNAMKQLEEMMPGVHEYTKRQLAIQKPPLTLKIVKTSGNNMSIIMKTDSGTDSDHSSRGLDRSRKLRKSIDISKKEEESNSNDVSTITPAIKSSASSNSAISSKPTTSTPRSYTSKSNYEVIAKPHNKDENNSTKINSVILKRKSEAVCLSPCIKKPKSSEENNETEVDSANPVITSLSPQALETNAEEIEDSNSSNWLRRKRPSRSNDKSLTAPGAVFVDVTKEPEKQQVQSQGESPITQEQSKAQQPGQTTHSQQEQIKSQHMNSEQRKQPHQQIQTPENQPNSQKQPQEQLQQTYNHQQEAQKQKQEPQRQQQTSQQQITQQKSSKQQPPQQQPTQQQPPQQHPTQEQPPQGKSAEQQQPPQKPSPPPALSQQQQTPTPPQQQPIQRQSPQLQPPQHKSPTQQSPQQKPPQQQPPQEHPSHQPPQKQQLPPQTQQQPQQQQKQQRTKESQQPQQQQSKQPQQQQKTSKQQKQQQQRHLHTQDKPASKQIQNSAVTSPKNKETCVSPTDSMTKFVQNRQGVTIKKISKNQSGVSTYIVNDERNPKNTFDDKVLSPAQKISTLQTNTPSPPSAKTTPSPPRNIQSIPISVSTSKQNPTIPLIPKQTTDRLVTPKGLIPFEDIKLENADDDLINALSKPPPSKSCQSTPTLSISSNASPALTLSSASTPTGIAKAPLISSDPLSVVLDPESVKTEVLSEDDSSQSSIPTETPASQSLVAVVVTQQPTTATAINNQNILEAPRLVGETMIKRIVVRSLESLTMQPPHLKSTPTSIISVATTTTTSSSSSSGLSPASVLSKKQQTARARKSFPNKGPNSSNAMLPPDVRRSLTKNSMVYIPVDSQKNSVPIKTAVSKTQNQPMVKVTGAANQNHTITSVNSAVTTTASPTLTLPTSVAIPLPAPPATTLSGTVVTCTNHVCLTTTSAVTSSTAYRPNYVVTHNTMSPHSPMPRPTEAMESDETDTNSREAEGHILSGIVTPNLAAAITDTIVCGPPRLSQKPNGALRSDGNYGFNSDAGPVCRKLVESAHKITDFFISVMQDTVSDMSNADVLPAKILELQMELETKTAEYEKRLYELKQNTDTMLCEMKKSMENERLRIIAETRKQCEIERIHAVEQTKKKQWCANCGREANSYCCWNTSYCDNNCQSIDWSRHKPNCCQVNPHLNNDVQGPGVLFSTASVSAFGSTVTTPSVHTISTPGFMPIQPIHLYQAIQPSSSISNAPFTQTPNATTNAKKVGASTHYASPACAHATIEMAYKSKEMLKLPPSTFLRAIQPNILGSSPPVHRFNIPLPINTSAAAGGPPYTLIQREGNWELLGSQSASNVCVPQSFQHTSQRLMATITANGAPDNRALNSITVRQNPI